MIAFLRRLVMVVGLAIAVMAATSCYAASHSKIYVNDEFGYSVPTNDMTTCRAEPPEHDTGVVILLDENTDRCDRPRHLPFIAIYASYNSMFANSATELLGLLADNDVEIHAANQTQLGFGKLASVSKRTRLDDGSVEIHVAAQAGKQRGIIGPHDEAAARINYEAILRTTALRLDADTERFRDVLSGIEVFEPR